MPKAQRRRAGEMTVVEGFRGLPCYDDPHDEWTAEVLEFWLRKLADEDRRLPIAGASRPAVQLSKSPVSKKRRRKAA
jgi:hypothetical protein